MEPIRRRRIHRATTRIPNPKSQTAAPKLKNGGLNSRRIGASKTVGSKVPAKRATKSAVRQKSKRSNLKLKSGGTRKLPKIRLRPKDKKSARKTAPKTVTRRRTIRRKRPQRVILLFSAGKVIHAKVSRKNASTIGEYLNAVDEFLKTNDPDHLVPFIGKSIKDGAGKTHVFETRPNAIYRLNAGIEPFEEIYRLIA